MLARIVDAHLALQAPGEINADRIVNTAICFVVAFSFCFITDKTFCRRFKRPYFLLHVLVNIVVTYLVLPGAIRALFNPKTSSVPLPGEKQPGALFLCWIYAIHIYHPLAFRTGLMDWIHHVPAYVLNTLIFSIPSSDAMHLQSIVMMGIPGGLDYVLQVLEGEGKLSRASYKEACSNINAYLRAPVGACSCYITLLGLYFGWEHTTNYQATVLLFLSLHAFWNPIFFGRQAVEANIVDTINRFELPGGNLKLPTVRGLCAKPREMTATTPSKPRRTEAYPIGSGEVSPSSVRTTTNSKKA